MSKWTPGPWRWSINRRGKSVELSGATGFVMDFARWGMSGATPRFNCDGNMARAECFAETIPGRAHHADWCQSLAHPDARLIAAAPALADALRTIADLYEQTLKDLGGCDHDVNICVCTDQRAIEQARAALAAAEGES